MRGSYYARTLSEAFETIWRATEDVSLREGPRSQKAQRVKLMCEPTFLNLWLADRLPDFRRLHPMSTSKSPPRASAPMSTSRSSTNSSTKPGRL